MLTLNDVVLLTRVISPSKNATRKGKRKKKKTNTWEEKREKIAVNTFRAVAGGN